MDSSSFLDGETQDTEETFTTQSTPNQEKRKETDGDISGQANAKKTSSKRSKVWKHFDPLKEDKDKCICRHCKRVYGCASSKGTSSLGKHMLTCKKLLAFEASKSTDMRAVTKDGQLVEPKVSEDIFKVAGDELLVLGELPLAFIESMAWRHFCNRVNLYTPHSRRTATRNIVKMYEERKAALKVWIAANKQRVSLTTDIWVAQATGASYMVITMHFIDANWDMRKLIIGFKYITNHKGNTITRILMECLAEWGIQKIFTITVDNATANTSALKKFQTQFSLVSDESLVLDGEFMHMRCCAHIINLIVKEGLLELVDNVCAIRNAVTYVRASTNRIDSFDSRADNVKVTRGSLPLDIKTRWNSTYLMLLQAIKFRKAFDKMEAEDRLYNDYFLELENGKKRIGPPTEVDWNAVERLVRFLIIFYNSTLIVSASNSVSSYKCYTEIVTIEKNLMNLSNSLDRELSEKADDMRAKFDKYWDGVKNINRLLIVASVLDPSKKMQFAKICFERLYGKDTAQAKWMYTSVTEVMKSLFAEYSTRSKKEPIVTPSQANQASTSGGHGSCTENMDFVNDEQGYERMDQVYKDMVGDLGVEDERYELDIYLSDKVENPNTLLGTEYDVLSWWKVNAGKFPILSEMARDVLAMQVSSVASESAFSTSGRIIDPYRSCLTHYMIEVLMCTGQWMKAEIKLGEKTYVSNTEMLADVTLQDELQKKFYPRPNLN